ncbi:LacI family DNA-binding transcriptional regulator [Poriferisphaera sp. WC338]|uniref:LacI family DNA-binding transcriptional regulator n=1 Tax=Poriferisphaera sp. WC338 TaxID=3425129 RepID=UPI003D814F53
MAMRLKDIASHAGVSISTVSRVLNGEPGPSEETVLQVRKAIESSGYLSKRLAVRKKQPKRDGIKTGNIGLVQLYEGNRSHAELYVELLRGACAALSSEGINVIVGQANAMSDLPPAILNRNVDGLLLLGSPVRGGEMETFLGTYTSVWLTSHNPNGEDDAVLAGNEKVGRVAAEYLVEGGHKNLAFINPDVDHAVFCRRGDAFMFAAQQKKVKVEMHGGKCYELDEKGLPNFGHLEAKLKPVFERMMNKKNRPTGFFIPNDLITAISYRILQSLGIQIGKDIEVISFGHELTYLAGLSPRPAMIDSGAELIGRRGVEQLLWRLCNPDQDRTVEVAIDPHIVPSETRREVGIKNYV